MRKFFTLRKDQKKVYAVLVSILLVLISLFGINQQALAQCPVVAGDYTENGTLVLDLNADSPADCSPTGYEQLVVNGNLAFGVTSVLDLDLNYAAAPGAGGIKYVVVTYTGTRTGTFNSTLLPAPGGTKYWGPVVYSVPGEISITLYDCASDDVLAPVPTCPPTPITLNTNPATQCSAPYSIPDVAVTDNCDLTVTKTVTVNGAAATIGSLVTLPKGLNTIVYTFTDDASNSATCTVEITVVDDDPPIINCPLPITVTSSGGQDSQPDDCGATAAWATLVASDNCPGVVVDATDATYTTIVPDPINTFFPVGTTTVYYRATDAAGNTDNCSFTVTVIDDEDPEITCPSGSPFNRDNDSNTKCYYTVSGTEFDPTLVDDNCSVYTVSNSFNGAATLAGAELPVGTHVITWTVDDTPGPGGNIATCDITVIVHDTYAPEITCPTPLLSYDTDPGLCTAELDFEAVIVDNCLDDVEVTFTIGGTDYTDDTPLFELLDYDFEKGSTTVTVKAFDGTNWATPCDFTVVVVDNEDPTVDCSVLQYNVPSDATCQFTVPDDSYDIPYDDNCPGESIVYTYTYNGLQTFPGSLTGAIFPKGMTGVTCTVTDASGNTADCSISFIVDDNFARVDAGADQTVCYSATIGVPISAIVYGEDNLPGGTGVWTGGAGTFANASANSTTYTPAVSEIGNTVTLTFTANDPDGAGPCTGGQTDQVQITVKHQPLLNATLNGVNVVDNNDGTTDQGSFTVCNDPNNITFLPGGVYNYGAGTGTNVKIYQTRTLTNVSFPYCNNCSATMAAFAPGFTTTASLINPTIQGTIVLTWQIWDDTNNDGVINGNECRGDVIQYNITVAPDPFTDNLGPFDHCSNVALNVDLQGQVSNSVSSNFTWVVTPNGNVSGEADGSGDYITQTLVNTTSNPETVVYTVTPTSDPEGCVGATFTVTVTVNPEPVASNATPTTCSNVALNVDLQAQVTNSVSSNFTWVVTPNGNVTGEADGSGDNITQTLVNTTSNPETVIYTVTPTSDPEGCVGATFTVTVTVNPEPVASNATPTTCSNVALNVDLQAQVTNSVSSNFTWVVTPNGNVTGEADGSGDYITQTLVNTTSNPETVIYTVTPTSDPEGCVGATFTVTVTVNPEPVASNATPTTCSNVALNVDLQAQVTNSVSSNFAWVVTPNGNVTGEADGSGDYITQTLVNTTSNPETVIYTVTPTSDPEGCVGATFTVTVTVNPEPVISDVPAKTVCNNTAIGSLIPDDTNGPAVDKMDIAVTAPVPFPTDFTYTGGNTYPQTGIPYNTNYIAADVYQNETNATVTVVYTITPYSAAGCKGTPFTITVNVEPDPEATPSASVETICYNTAPVTTVDVTAINGHKYLVSAVTTSDVTNYTTIPYTVADGGAIETNSLLTAGPGVGTITYTIVPYTNGPDGADDDGIDDDCLGTPFNVVITVEPEPKATPSHTAQIICDDATPTVTVDVTAINGNNYLISAISNPNGITGVSTAPVTRADGGLLEPNALSNPTNLPRDVVYTVIPYTYGPNGNNNSGTPDDCLGTPFDVTITVDVEAPVGTNQEFTVCHASDWNFDISSYISNYIAGQHEWKIEYDPEDIFVENEYLDGGLPEGTFGTADIIANDVINNSTQIRTLVYEVTPRTILNHCPGTPFTVTIHVLPEITADVQPNGDLTLCVDEVRQLSSNVVPAGDYNYAWTVSSGNGALLPPTNSTLVDLKGVSAGFVTVTLTVTDANNGCVAATDSEIFEIFDNPVAGATASDSDICEGETVQLTATGGGTYQWDDPLNSTTPVINVSPTATTTYTVVVTNAAGCTDEASVTINVTPAPEAPQTIGNTVCYNSPNGPIQAQCESLTCVIKWYDALVGGNLKFTGAVYDPIANGDVLPTAVGSHNFYAECICNGCPGPRSLAVLTINPNPGASIVLTPAGPFCEFAAPVTLQATPSGGSWSGNGITNSNTGAFDPALAFVLEGGGPGSETVTVTYTYTDPSGCTAAKSMLITITEDVTNPVISGCPVSPVVAYTLPSNCFVFPTWTAPTASDDCKLVSFTNNVQTAYVPGSYNIVYTATDAAGNTSQCTFTFTVIDNTPPSIFACPTSTTIDTDPLQCSKSYSWNSPATQDACGLLTWTVAYTAGTPVPASLPAGGSLVSPLSQPTTAIFYLGQTIVTYTATDANNNTNTCTFTVTVTENDAPSFADPLDHALTTNGGAACPAVAAVSGVVVGVVASEQPFTVAGLPFNAPKLTAYGSTVAGEYGDACDATPTLTLESITPVLARCNSTITLVWKVTDDYTNSIIQNQVFTIADNTAPALTGTPPNNPSGINMCYNDVAAAFPFDAANAIQGYTDNCGGSVTAINTSVSLNGSDCNWILVYTYTVKDICNNELTGQTYTVTGSDKTAPSLTGSPYAQVGFLSGCKPTQTEAEAMFSTTKALQGYSDNCLGTITATRTNTTVTGTNCNWTVTHTYTVRDECNNSLTGRSYLENGKDDTPPALTGSPYAQVGFLSGCKPTQTAAEAMWNASKALQGYSDICSGFVLTAVRTGTVVTGDNCLWNVEHTYKVVDQCNNELTGQKYNENGKDSTKPALTSAAYTQVGFISGCKPDQATAELMFSATKALQGYSDNCSGTNLTAVRTLTTVLGTDCSWVVTHTYKVVDQCNNELTNRTYSESGKDNTPPALTGSPFTQTGYISGCKPTGGISMWDPSKALMGYTDNCSGTNLTVTRTNTVVTGTNCNWTVTHTYTVKDQCNNSLTNQTYSETGKDDTPPALTGSPYAQVGLLSGCKPTQAAAEAMFNASKAVQGYSDICSGTSLIAVWVSTAVTGDNCNWNVEHTYKVVDACNNELTGQKYDEDGKDDTPPALTGSPFAQVGLLSGCKPLQAAAEAMFSTTKALQGYSDICSGTSLTAVWVSTLVTGTDCNWNVEHTYKVVDACNNELTGQKYDEDGKDDTAPALTGAAYVQTGFINDCKPSQAAAEAMFSTTKALQGYSDICSGTSLTAVWVSTLVTGTDCNWNVEHTYKVVDACNNELTGQKYDEDGKDDTAPTFTVPGPVTIQCSDNPNNLTLTGDVTDEADNCGLLGSGQATYTDNTSGLTGCNNTGTIIRTWRLEDACGKITTQTQTITVIDNTIPVWTSSLPANQTYNVTESDCNLFVPFAKPTATDNCSVPVISASAVNASGVPVILFDLGANYGGTFPTGVNTVTLKATDGCGNTLIHQFTITIIDPIIPTIICPPTLYGQCNISEVPPYVNAFAFQLGGGILDDNCSVAPATFTLLSQTPDGNVCPQTITRVYRIADLSGNTNTCSQSIVIDDTQPPVGMIVPGPATVSCDADITPPIYGTASGATDNCPVPVTYSYIDASTKGTDPALCNFYTYGITRTWIATDGCGNTATGTQLFTVQDVIAPTITACNDITVYLDGSGNHTLTGADLLAILPDANVSDVCAADANLTRSALPVSFTCSNTGSSVPVVLTVKDPCLNSNTCTVNVTVLETVPPVAVCNDITIELDATGNYNLTAADKNTITAGTTDNCGVFTSTFSDEGFSCVDVPLSPVAIVVTYQDPSGNTSNCTAYITVEDNRLPDITCVPDQTRNTDPGVCQYTAVGTEFDATFTDNCPNGTITNNYDNTSSLAGSVFPKGITTVIWTVTDASGNTATCQTVITIDDNEAPVITCVPDQTRNTDLGVCQYTAVGTEFDATFTDNCPDGVITNNYDNSSSLAGSVFPKGVTTVVWTVNDGNGQTATCQTVITIDDNEAPVITCVPDQTRNTDLGVCQYTAVGTEFDATFTDNCPDGTITNSYDNTSSLAGSVFPKGVTTVVWTVNDGNGQTATCQTVITIDDNEAPVITCVLDQNRNTDPGVCQYTAVGTEFDATFTDNCPDGTITNDYDNSSSLAGSVFPKGVTTVVWTVNDGNGQTATCQTVITIDDNEAPVITCVTDQTRPTDLGVCQYTAVGTEFDATFTDNCPNGTITNDYDNSSSLAGSVFPKGVTTVVWTVDDGNGQTATCQTVITVYDNQGPVFTCPAAESLDQSPTSCFTPYSKTFAQMTDNCSAPGDIAVTVTCTLLENGDNVPLTVTNLGNGVWSIAAQFGLPVGNNQITVSATDLNGQNTTCSYVVDVNDVWAPIISCPANVVVNAPTGNCFAQAFWNDPTVSDFCPSSYTLTSTHVSGSTFPVPSVTTVTYTVTDNAGNSNSCSFTVTINGVCLPNIDLRPQFMNTSGTYIIGETRDHVVRIRNIGTVATTGTIQFFVPKINGYNATFNGAQTIANLLVGTTAVNNGDWTVTNLPTGKLFTSTVPIGPGGESRVAMNYTATTLGSTGNILVNILTGTGGDTNPSNNSGSKYLSTSY